MLRQIDVQLPAVGFAHGRFGDMNAIDCKRVEIVSLGVVAQVKREMQIVRTADKQCGKQKDKNERKAPCHRLFNQNLSQWLQPIIVS